MDFRYVGNTSQLFDVRRYTFVGGKSDGTQAIDVWNGADLHVTLLPDRSLDIYSVRYKNHNMAFHTPSGVVAPAFYSDYLSDWLRSFAGGFMVTCGLQKIGDGDPDDPSLPVHGRISNTPAENLSVDLSDDGLSVTISGLMREAVLFGAKLTLKRSIRLHYGENAIYFNDTVTNQGFERQPLSMLYHFNMGYPLLSESAKVYIPAVKTVPRTAHAASDMNWGAIPSPISGFEEMVYYHFLSENKIGIDNDAIDTSVRIEFDSPEGILDRAIQWRMFGCGDYVMGLEPASCTLESRADAIANGSQKYIDGRSSIHNNFKISFGPAAK
ncbi:MAG: aldose 1-epimerase family protein [Firmicutes bacterium]|nr:aldose 1-epimerase family protein [Bacillota bacterium]